MPTQAEITASLANSPQHLLENILANVDHTTATPPQLSSASTAAQIVAALSTVGYVEDTT